MAHQHLVMWKHTEEQKAILSDSYHHLAVESTLELKRQRDMFLKEIEDTFAKLSRQYDRHIEELTARAHGLQTTCEIITRQHQQEAQAIRDELDTCRAQYEMGEIRIKALIAKHRQKFNNTIEEALARAWQEWSAQAAELQVLRADAENQWKEGRGFYKMDENSIQILHEDLIKEFHAFAKSHTTSIEQLLEDFNGDQMLFRLDVEAYEQE